MKLLCILLAAESALAYYEQATRLPSAAGHGTDLGFYHSRPDLRAPLLDVKVHDAGLVTPGYWLLSAYANLEPGRIWDEFTPFQNGPHIYDYRGELVWSGAPLFEFRNVFDFHVGLVNGSRVLTGSVDQARLSQSDYPVRPFGFILDNRYQLIQMIEMADEYDMHELNSISNNRFLVATSGDANGDLVDEDGRSQSVPVSSGGFRELDLSTGHDVFRWKVADHVKVSESMMRWSDPLLRSSDFFHINSIDKTSQGDYLVSLRHTSAVYKVSAQNGAILWRLGGKKSDFVQNFNFSSQHHARILREGDRETVISLFNNAAGDEGIQPETASASSVQIIKLHHGEQPQRAQLQTQYVRPDGRLSKKRGSAQVLDNGNVFIGWGDRGYMTEHAPDGRPVLEASFLSDRFSTYRAYHLVDWVGYPAEPPALISNVYQDGSSNGRPSTVMHVSWNCATNVASWRFYGSPSNSSDLHAFEYLGSLPKVSFESSISVNGYWRYIYAEAYDAQSKRLGQSEVRETLLPERSKAQFEYLGRTWKFRFSLRSSDSIGLWSLVTLGCVFYTALSLVSRTRKHWHRLSILKSQARTTKP